MSNFLWRIPDIHNHHHSSLQRSRPTTCLWSQSQRSVRLAVSPASNCWIVYASTRCGTHNSTNDSVCVSPAPTCLTGGSMASTTRIYWLAPQSKSCFLTLVCCYVVILLLLYFTVVLLFFVVMFFSIILYRVRTGPGKPGHLWNLIIWISGLESRGIFVRVMESYGIWRKLWNLILAN